MSRYNEFGYFRTIGEPTAAHPHTDGNSEVTGLEPPITGGVPPITLNGDTYSISLSTGDSGGNIATSIASTTNALEVTGLSPIVGDVLPITLNGDTYSISMNTGGNAIHSSTAESAESIASTTNALEVTGLSPIVGGVLPITLNGDTYSIALDVNTRVSVASSTYTADVNDKYIAVLHTPTSPVSITLPQITTLGGNKTHTYVITDEGGNASNNNITIHPHASDTIIGDTSLVINGNYNSVTLYSNTTTGWFLR